MLSERKAGGSRLVVDLVEATAPLWGRGGLSLGRAKERIILVGLVLGHLGVERVDFRREFNPARRPGRSVEVELARRFGVEPFSFDYSYPRRVASFQPPVPVGEVEAAIREMGYVRTGVKAALTVTGVYWRDGRVG